jgi:glutaredoxin 3
MSKAKVYTKVGCPHCAAAKEDLEKRGVSYDEIDVFSVPGAAEEAMRLAGGRKMVPVIVDGSKVTLGFDGGS